MATKTLTAKRTGKHARVYLARDEDALRNGSYVRLDHAESAKGSWYTNGDYMGDVSVADLTEPRRRFSYSEALPLLPRCGR